MASQPCKTSRVRKWESFRRRCVESLQADTRQLEAQVTKCSALALEVEAMMDRQLATTRLLLGASPATLKVRSPMYRNPIVFLSFMAVIAMAIRESWFIGILCLAAYILVLGFSRGEFEFDGRWLRITRRMCGVGIWVTTSVDLARFNRLVLTDFDNSFENTISLVTKVEVHSLAGGVMELGTGAQGREMKELCGQLREWCTIAAGEAPSDG